VTANTFTIAAGATTAVLNAVPVDDAIINPGETIKVNVTADPNNFNYFLDPVVANTTATLTITDNDFPTVNLSFPQSQLQKQEVQLSPSPPQHPAQLSGIKQ
jgi:hypothetical protein